MGVLSIIRTPVVTETCGPKIQEVYECIEAHHSEFAHARSMQGANANASTHTHKATPNQYIHRHTLLQYVWTLSTRRGKMPPQEWGPVPNELEDIIGERCTDGKYIICSSYNEFDPQRGKVKCSCQRYFGYGSFKEHTTTDYHKVNTARNQAERKRLNDYIIEHGCSPPPCKKQVPLSTFFRQPLDPT